MGKIVCFARNLGLTEDKYILPFVLKYKLPLLILEIHNHNTAEKLKKKGIAISCQPNNTDSITESLKWGCKTLKMMDTATLITSIYAFKNEEMELSNKLIKDISLVQITHGSDDRNILDKGYNILSGFPYFDLLLLDNNYWANLAKEVCGNKTKIRVIGNIHLSLFLKKDIKKALNSKYLFYKENNLNLNKKTILYAPSWHQKSRKDILGNGFFERCGIEICNNVPSRFNLIVKPHPISFLHSKKYIKDFKDFFKNRKDFVFIEENIDILPLILYADLVISDHSVICPLSLSMDKNLIVYDPTKNPIFFDYIIRHCDYAKNIKDLKKFIDLSANNPSRKQNLRKKFIKESGFLNPNAFEDAWSIITEFVNSKKI